MMKHDFFINKRLNNDVQMALQSVFLLLLLLFSENAIMHSARLQYLDILQHKPSLVQQFCLGFPADFPGIVGDFITHVQCFTIAAEENKNVPRRR